MPITSARLDALSPPSLSDSQAYCRRVARSHYENFAVASWLLPRHLRQHFCNVYAYCRIADDLADEVADAEQSLQLLDAWQGHLEACYQGRANHPVFVALAETIRQFEVPRQPWLDLLTAFRQDQRVRRYETFDELLEYCRHSANPVGRLMLCLGRCLDARRSELSDFICTGLQLANFCQDVAGDWKRGRLYLPRESLRRFGCDESMFDQPDAYPPLRRLLEAEVDRARAWLEEGQPLVPLMPKELRLELALIVAGGLAILDEIRRVDFDVWTGRPTISATRKVRLLLGACFRRFLS